MESYCVKCAKDLTKSRDLFSIDVIGTDRHFYPHLVSPFKFCISCYDNMFRNATSWLFR